MSRFFRNPLTGAAAMSTPLRPGDYQLSLAFDRRNRTFLVHVPPQVLDDVPLPVVVNFHGSSSRALQQRLFSGMDATADRYGFIVIYPNGTGVFHGQRRFLAFDAGGCCPPATWNSADDVGFTESILSVLEEKISVDVGRIYATGMSNGGMMAHRMAVESPRIAAVASVAGQLAVTCRPSRPVSVMQFHSVDDPVALYEGRKARRIGGLRVRTHYPSVQAGIDQWVAHNDCPPTPVISESLVGSHGSLDQGQTVTKITYGPGQNGTEVVLYRFTGSGHVWPGSPMSLPILMGRATTLIDANEVMWHFFTAHPLSPTR